MSTYDKSIHDVCRIAEDASYLVIGGKRRSPVGKALFGSTTQTVLLNATCPVVTTVGDDGH